MIKETKIPVWRSGSYGKSYFRHDPDTIANNAGHLSTEYFEIQQRCLWQDNIPSHRLDFYLVFLVMAGEGIHTFGAEEYCIKENMLCFAGPNIITSWRSLSKEHRGFFCAFSDDFFNLGKTDKNFLNELPFFQAGVKPVLELTTEQTQYYFSLFSTMWEEYTNRDNYSADVLRSQLHVLIHKAVSQYHHANEITSKKISFSGNRLLKAFTTLYMNDFKKINRGETIGLRKVADYAKELGVSQNYLNDSIKSLTGQSAGQLIKNQLIRQASMCLKHSSKSISEIAYLLGFEDPSYFSRYFKSQTGRLPSEMRR